MTSVYVCTVCGYIFRLGVGDWEWVKIAEEMGAPSREEAYADTGDKWKKRNEMLEQARRIYYKNNPNSLQKMPEKCPQCTADKKNFLEQYHYHHR